MDLQSYLTCKYNYPDKLNVNFHNISYKHIYREKAVLTKPQWDILLLLNRGECTICVYVVKQISATLQSLNSPRRYLFKFIKFVMAVSVLYVFISSFDCCLSLQPNPENVVGSRSRCAQMYWNRHYWILSSIVVHDCSLNLAKCWQFSPSNFATNLYSVVLMFCRAQSWAYVRTKRFLALASSFPKIHHMHVRKKWLYEVKRPNYECHWNESNWIERLWDDVDLVNYSVLTYTLQARLKNAKPHSSLTFLLDKMMCLLVPNTVLLHAVENTNLEIP